MPVLHVFIADDSEPIVEMLTELLTDPGKVEVVGVGASETAAIEAVLALRPHVVLVDLQLGSGSGTNVIRAIRAQPQLAGVRLLVTSNHNSPQLRAACLQLGADEYFDKVKDIGTLAQRIGALALELEQESRKP